MQSFIHNILEQLLNQDNFRLENTRFILPSRRSGQFLKKELQALSKTTSFAPEVLSTEEFIEDITHLQGLDHTQSLFALYETYRALTPQDDLESFEVFYGWAQNLIYDFNEIDRYLIDAGDLFDYLSQIKDLDHWSLPGNQTEMIKSYLNFWHRQPEYYEHFKTQLLEQNQAYQGLMYRRASSAINEYLDRDDKTLIFIGFNALNNAEQKIIKTVLERERGQIFWDLDRAFYADKQHEAGLFIRRYAQEWDFYQNNPDSFKELSSHFNSPKDLNITGVAKNIGQAKLVGKILDDLPQNELSQTAVVLNDEALLLPVLNALPQHIEHINITMGLPLSETPLAPLIETLFHIQLRNDKNIYHQHLLDLLSAPGVLYKTGKPGQHLRDEIIQKNKIFVSIEDITRDYPALSFLSPCLSPQKSPHKFLNTLEQLMLDLKPQESQDYPLQTEYLFHFNKLFKKLQNLLSSHKSLKSVRGLHKIYRDALQNESLDFQGSPFSGLQIMGMLETRSLDFDNIILTSVNEGVLPAGKSQNTFIPYDLKKEYGLPTFREKDAVYTYHFYRLLQRAKNIELIYNSDDGGLNGGEQSRFLMQLKTEAKHFTIEERVGSSPVPPYQSEPQEIAKGPAVMQKLRKLAAHGFSPSALTTYIRNPIDFYRKYIHGIQDADKVEETVAFNTLGTVVHNALENLHKPFLNSPLREEDIKTMGKKTSEEIERQFYQEYGTDFLNGKNRLIFEVARRYVVNFLNLEADDIKEGEVTITGLEDSFTRKLPETVHNSAVKLKGKLDRIDYYKGSLRIIDYKTGKVDKNDLTIKDWSLLNGDYKYSKTFQVLCYAYLLGDTLNDYDRVQGGIVSFKNLRAGFLNFAYKGKEHDKTDIINAEVMEHFENELVALVREILNPEIPFIEKEP